MPNFDMTTVRRAGDSIGLEPQNNGQNQAAGISDDTMQLTLTILKELYEAVFDWNVAANTVVAVSGQVSFGPSALGSSMRIVAEDALDFICAYLLHPDDKDKLRDFVFSERAADPAGRAGAVKTIALRTNYDGKVEHIHGDLIFIEDSHALFCCRHVADPAGEHQGETLQQTMSLNRQLSALVSSIPEGLIVFQLNEEGEPNFTFLSKKALPYFGINNADYVRAISKGDDLNQFVKYTPLDNEEFAALAKEGEIELRIAAGDYMGFNSNKPLWVSMTCDTVDLDGEIMYYATIRDISDEKYASKQVQWQEQASQDLALAAKVTLSIAFDAATGYRLPLGSDILPRTFAEVRTLPELFAVTRQVMHPEDVERMRWEYDAQDWVDACASNGGHVQITARLRSAVEDRGYEPFSISINYVEGDYDGSGILYIVVLALDTDAISVAKPREGTPDTELPTGGMKQTPITGSTITNIPRPDKPVPVTIRTFGAFDVFYNDKPLLFKHKKAQELLAILVDRRGGYLTSEEAVALLWPEDAYNKVTQSRYRKVAMRLRNILEEYDIEYILETVNGNRRIDTARVNCDLYDYLSGDHPEEQLFKGSYMQGYDWAQATREELEKQ